MRIWAYGDSPEQLRDMIKTAVGSGDSVVGTSVRAKADSEFPQSGLTPAISAAIRGEIDLLLIPAFELLGCGTKARQMAELFQSYGVSIKSLSNCGISSS